MRIRKLVVGVATLGAAATLIGIGAQAYWTGPGSGAGSVKNAGSVADVAITQTASIGVLAPGMSVPLAGLLTNPNSTDVKVGTLTATIAGVDGNAAAADFTITGNGVLVNAVVKKGNPLSWSGMTLNYANTDVNQDSGKNATVSLTYAVTAFQENVVPPLGTKTVTMVNGVRTVTVRIDNVGGVALTPGAQVVVWHGGTPPNGWACAGTTSTFCNLTAPAPTYNIYGQLTAQNGTPVDSTLPKVGADGVLSFTKAMTASVGWWIGGAAVQFTL